MLFQSTESDKVRKLNRAPRCPVNNDRYINAYVKKDLHGIFGQFKMGEAIHYANDTLFYLHDVIAYCLGQTGPAEVYFSTYAIKEFQARMICQMKSDGAITKLHSLLDDRNLVFDSGAVQLLKKNADRFGFNRTHSKLVVIRNSKWGISIVTSANLTKNTRLDVGVITCSIPIADERIRWINKNTKHEAVKKTK